MGEIHRMKHDFAIYLSRNSQNVMNVRDPKLANGFCASFSILLAVNKTRVVLPRIAITPSQSPMRVRWASRDPLPCHGNPQSGPVAKNAICMPACKLTVPFSGQLGGQREVDPKLRIEQIRAAVNYGFATHSTVREGKIHIDRISWFLVILISVWNSNCKFMSRTPNWLAGESDPTVQECHIPEPQKRSWSFCTL